MLIRQLRRRKETSQLNPVLNSCLEIIRKFLTLKFWGSIQLSFCYIKLCLDCFTSSINSCFSLWCRKWITSITSSFFFIRCGNEIRLKSHYMKYLHQWWRYCLILYTQRLSMSAWRMYRNCCLLPASYSSQVPVGVII